MSMNKLLCRAAVDRRGSVVEKKEDTQADGGLPWMMKEDQEYTVMEPGALLLPRSSTGPHSLLSQGMAPASKGGNRPRTSGAAGRTDREPP